MNINKELSEKKKEAISVGKNVIQVEEKSERCRKRKRHNKDAKKLAKKLAKNYETYLNEKLDSYLQLQGFFFLLKVSYLIHM